MTYQRGHVGMKLAAKQQVLTTSGRITSPSPSWKKITGQLHNRIDAWLLAEYKQECITRGDEYGLLFAEQADPKNITPAENQAFQAYLFDREWAHIGATT